MEAGDGRTRVSSSCSATCHGRAALAPGEGGGGGWMALGRELTKWRRVHGSARVSSSYSTTRHGRARAMVGAGCSRAGEGGGGGAECLRRGRRSSHGGQMQISPRVAEVGVGARPIRSTGKGIADWVRYAATPARKKTEAEEEICAAAAVFRARGRNAPTKRWGLA